jgi:filamentous hemagglutinin
MDVRSPLFQNIAAILAGVMFLNPIVVAAAELTAAAGSGATVGQAGNGVPLVNIAEPNANGLSHNQFQDYNVGQQGLILNNATERTQNTQLGGIILGNSNLNGRAAGMILNEVTGSNASRLQGYTEVAGKSAHVIVANPHGITCDGCGFINTPRVTLSTGTPIIENGRLDRFDVNGGHIGIEGQGLNASNVDQFDLITRSAKINAELHANKLNVITGRNEVKSDDLSATAKAPDGSDKPQLAIDSSALGGMYAGAIRLVGTEAGVGVKLAGDMAASAGDIRIDANGHLTVGTVSASDNLAVKAGDVDFNGKAYAGGQIDVSAQKQLNVSQSLAAAGAVNIRSSQVVNSGVVEAGNSRAAADLTISAHQVRNAGTLVGTGTVDINASQTLDNRGGTVSANTLARIVTAQLDNRQGRVLANESISIAAHNANNHEGLIYSQGANSLTVEGVLDNQRGRVIADGGLKLDGGRIDNTFGELASKGELSARLNVLTQQGGKLISQSGMNVSANVVDNSRGGQISSQQTTTLEAQTLNNAEAGRISSAGNLSISTGQLDNSHGSSIIGSGDLEINAGAIRNSFGGAIASSGDLRVTASSLDASDKGEMSSAGNLSAQISGAINLTDGGELLSDNAITIRSGTLDTRRQGLIAANENLFIEAATIDNSYEGELSSRGLLTLKGESLDNRFGGRVIGEAGLEAVFGRLDNTVKGVLASNTTLGLNVVELNNSQAGTISGAQLLTLTAGKFENQSGGRVLSDKDLRIVATQMNNSESGLVSSGGSLSLLGRSVDNQAGTIMADGQATVAVEGISSNFGGRILSRGNLSVSANSLTQRDGGQMLTNGQLSLDVDHLDNNAGGLISAGTGMQLTSLSVDNQGGEIASVENLFLTADVLNNDGAGKILAGNVLSLTVERVLNRAKSTLYGQHSVLMTAGELENGHGGTIASGGGIRLDVRGLLNNQDDGAVVSQGPLSLIADRVENREGTLSSRERLDLQVGELHNQGGAVLAAGVMTLTGTRLDNSQRGTINGSETVTLGFTAVDNSVYGDIAADGNMYLEVGQVTNNLGRISSKGDLQAEIQSLTQNHGELLAEGALTLRATNVSNLGGVIAANRNININTSTLINKDAGEISGRESVFLDAELLDNSNNGRILADSLTVTVERILNRAQAVLSGRTALTVLGNSLDNSEGGTLSSLGPLRISLGGHLLNRNNGSILSEEKLSIEAESVNNSEGVISSAAALSIVSGGGIDNVAGKVVTDGAMDLTSRSLSNQSGKISARHDLTVATGDLNNSHQGTLASEGMLRLNAAAVDNSAAGRIASKGALIANLQGLDQHDRGEVLSETALEINLNGGKLNNSQRGVVVAPNLVLNNVSSIDNSNGGEVSSAGNLILAMNDLDNRGGLIASGGAIALQINQSLLNNLKGSISAATGLQVSASELDNSDGGALASRGNVSVETSGVLNNKAAGVLVSSGTLTLRSGTLNNNGGGLLSSEGDLTLTTGALDNSVGGRVVSDSRLAVNSAEADNSLGGVLSGQQGVNLQSSSINNRNGGLITSGASLEVVADSLDSSDKGEVSAKGYLSLLLRSLTQRHGSLIGETGVYVDLQGGEINNRGGLISARGPLNLVNLRKLDNRDKGEISGNQSFSILADLIDNGEHGSIISAGQLDLQAASLRNATGGLLSGWQGLRVNGGVLDNSNAGTLSSRDGELSVALTGGLNNQAEGALVSKDRMTLKAANLSNANGGIISGQSDVQLDISGAFNNAQGGLIAATGVLSGTVGEINNRNGKLDVSELLLGAASLENSGGSFSSAQGLKLTLLGALTNQGGQLVSGGPLVLKSAIIDNRGGRIVSQGLFGLLTGALNNSNGGTLASRDSMTLDLSGELNNSQDGLIYSQNGSLGLSANSLNNTAGSLQSQVDLSADLSGALHNQGGRISTIVGNLALQGSSLDNRAGVINSAAGALKLVTPGLLTNSSGVFQAASIDVVASGGILNGNGHLSALAGDALIQTAIFDNKNGGLFASDLLRVNAGSFDNQAEGGEGGKVSARAIDFSLNGALNNRKGIIESDGTLSLRSAAIYNAGGNLRAFGNAGTTYISTSGALDNRFGTIETANFDLSLSLASFLNADGKLLHTGGGTFGLSTNQVMQAGGALVTNGTLTLAADSWINSSMLQAGRLILNIGTFSQTNEGQLLSSHSLTGTGVNWSNNGLLASDGTVNINLTGQYSGNGKLTSLGELTLNTAGIDLTAAASVAAGGAGTINTTGTLTNRGRLTAASDLTIRGAVIDNYGTLGSAQKLRLYAPNLQSTNGLVFSGNDMALRVDTFVNRYSDVYSLGALDIARDDAGASALMVSNRSATIESGGSLSIASSTVENTKDRFDLETKMISGSLSAICLESCFIEDNRYYQGSGQYVLKENFRAQATMDSVSSTMVSGNDLKIASNNFTNSNSTISAARNISIETIKFENAGSQIGDYSVTKYYESGRHPRNYSSLMAAVVTNEFYEYNRTNNPNFPYLEYTETIPAGRGQPITNTYKLVPYVHMVPASDSGVSEYVEVYWVPSTYEIDTDRSLSSQPHLIYNRGSLEEYWSRKALEPQFGKKPLVAAPQSITSLPLAKSEVTGEFANYSSIVQAGGSVTINAKDSITNGVVTPFSHVTRGQGRVATTSVGSSTHAVSIPGTQLPPDLQQRQVNPLSLPGFALPKSQNGLFRLSSEAVEQASGSSASSQDANAFIMSGRTVGLGAHEQRIGYTDWDARSFSVGTRDALGATAATRSGWTLGNSTGAIVGRGSDINPLVPSSVPLLVDVGAQMVTRSQGVLPSNRPAGVHKYLIETNPVLTELKQFMSSDYLLGHLGYDTDLAQKRLGDGLYEQRLIRDAIVARTGQRFIEGLTSDEAMFRYLMDNAIGSKESLGLSLGVSLTAQQVAALTHDIVWMEEYEVEGEKVLVPVLYLAQADGRLAPNGALIQGADVSLIAGKELVNQGTLRAANNISAVVGGSLINSGLFEAGNRLDLLAKQDITNQQGGILAGRDVTLTALTGDVLNQRSTVRGEMLSGGQVQIRDYVDNASRIESSGRLDITAGRDILNLGSVIQSKGDINFDAGRDVTLASVQELNRLTKGRNFVDEQTAQYGASISSGRDISINAGRDLTIIASRIEAQRDIAFDASGDVLLSAAANEDHFYSKSKKTTRQNDVVTQQSTEIRAGRDVGIDAAGNVVLVASNISAGGEAYLVAGDQLALLSAEDLDYSLYDMKKKGSFGSKKSKRDEVTDVRNVGSSITTGGDLTLVSEGNQLYQKARLESGGDLTLDAGGVIVFEAVKDLHQESHEKSSNSLAWTSAKGKGNTDETLQQSVLIAKGETVINAVDGLRIDIRDVNKQTVSQTIDAMVKVDPEFAWIKEAEARGDVDWQRVKEVHESFQYSQSGLGAGAQLVIAIVASAYLGPLMGALASNTAVGTINNGGNLGKGIKFALNEDNLKSYAIAAAAAYVITPQLDQAFGVSTDSVNKITKGFDLGNLSDVVRFGAYSAVQGVAQAGLETTVNGGSFSDNLEVSLIAQAGNVGMAIGFNMIGDWAYGKYPDGSPQKVMAHALFGGLVAEATGSDFKTGALAAGANEALSTTLTSLVGGDENLELMSAQIVGLLAAASVDGDLFKGTEIAKFATAYNQHVHREAKQRLERGLAILHEQGKYPDLDADTVLQDLRKIASGDLKSTEELNPKVIKFLNTEFTPAGLRDQMFEPENWEVYASIAIDLGFPTPSSKAAAVRRIGEKVSKETLASLEAKYGADLLLRGGPKGTAAAPKITIRDHYDHHLNMVDDIKDQLTSQGYKVSQKEASFGSSCGAGRCRPDIVARAPDGSIRIIEVKTGGADLSIRQSKIFPQIESGSSIPRGKVARDFGLIPGKPLKDQGYPNGIPIETKFFPGAT